jgi:hypothetical protein
MVLLIHKGYISIFNEVALKIMKAKLKSKLFDKIQCKSTVSNLTKISYVIWAMLDVDKDAGNIEFLYYTSTTRNKVRSWYNWHNLKRIQ